MLTYSLPFCQFRVLRQAFARHICDYLSSQSLEDQDFVVHIKHEALGKESIEQYGLFPFWEFDRHLFNMGFNKMNKTQFFSFRHVQSEEIWTQAIGMAKHNDKHTKGNGGHRGKGENFNYKNQEGFMEEEVYELRCK